MSNLSKDVVIGLVVESFVDCARGATNYNKLDINQYFCSMNNIDEIDKTIFDICSDACVRLEFYDRLYCRNHLKDLFDSIADNEFMFVKEVVKSMLHLEIFKLVGYMKLRNLCKKNTQMYKNLSIQIDECANIIDTIKDTTKARFGISLDKFVKESIDTRLQNSQ